eukprot:GFYU01002603.1.p2 GENE.GFYU01002603.1~~GFYU01002603.1.p2  ORF type:complete len:129 (-),score=53.50 GFYU01002603.1:661-1047(-)
MTNVTDDLTADEVSQGGVLDQVKAAYDNIVNSDAAKKVGAVSNSVLDAGKGMLFGTGRVAWIATTSFMVLALPLIIEIQREQELIEMENYYNLAMQNQRVAAAMTPGQSITPGVSPQSTGTQAHGALQ